METFILALVYALPAFLRPLAQPVADRLIRVWRWSEGLARRIKSAFLLFLIAAIRLKDGVIRFIGETYTTLRWIIFVRIPLTVANIRSAIVKWVTERITDARNILAKAINALHQWAVRAVNGLQSLLTSMRRWAADLLAKLRTAVNRLLDRVFSLWSTPERLAVWLVAAMWRALWRFAWANADRLAMALWARRRAIFLRTVAEAERIIGRVL